MSGGSMAARVTRGIVLVAALSALLLAVASSLAARLLWQARDERELRAAADAIVAATAREAHEDGLDATAAVQEALRESTLPGDVAEVWKGTTLIASSPDADGAAAPPARRETWTRHTRPLANGLTLVLAKPPDHARRAASVFGYSLALAMPVCLAAAVVVARIVARRTTRPLLDLQTRIHGLRTLEPLPAPSIDDMPLEVREVEDAFRGLWTRLDGMLSRELEFAANASHELRMPLTRIRLNAERALADAGPLGRSALVAQLEEVDRLTRLLDSLLVLARDTSTGVPGGETVNLADVGRRVTARSLRDARQADCAFPDEALLRGDELLIEIAVENLIDNAREFAVSGEPVRMQITDTGAGLSLLVTTPGARVAERDRDRVFDRFRRGAETRPRATGHGLGLALARDIARLHGGDVRCVSMETEDARFALELPPWTDMTADTPR